MFLVRRLKSAATSPAVLKEKRRSLKNGLPTLLPNRGVDRTLLDEPLSLHCRVVDTMFLGRGKIPLEALRVFVDDNNLDKRNPGAHELAFLLIRRQLLRQRWILGLGDLGDFAEASLQGFDCGSFVSIDIDADVLAGGCRSRAAGFGDFNCTPVAVVTDVFKELARFESCDARATLECEFEVPAETWSANMEGVVRDVHRPQQRLKSRHNRIILDGFPCIDR